MRPPRPPRCVSSRGPARGRSPSAGGPPPCAPSCTSRPCSMTTAPSSSPAPRGCGRARRAMTSYAELHAHSAFSFLDGASQPEELVREAVRLGLSGLALTDHDGLYGVVRFAQAARAAGLPTVFGAELHLPVVDAVGRAVLDPPTGVPDPRATHLLVLARGPDGYRAMSAAIAEAHLATGTKGQAAYRLEELAARAAGQWLVLTGCRKGAVRRALDEASTPGAGLEAARRELDRLRALFGPENVAVEVTRSGDPFDDERADALAHLAAAVGAPLVATGNVHYASPDRKSTRLNSSHVRIS